MSLPDAGTGPTADGTGTPRVARARDPDRELVADIVDAFGDAAVDVEPTDREPLYEWIDTDGLAAILESSRYDCRLETVIWGHRTVVTPHAVEIYEPIGPVR